MIKGMICLFFGLIAAIPDGWSLCDGTNSTPDLRNQFVVGAGDTYNPGDNGGAINHDHTFIANNHFHTINFGSDVGLTAGYWRQTSLHAVVGTTDNANGLPPYYSLSYIMKDG